MPSAQLVDAIEYICAVNRAMIEAKADHRGSGGGFLSDDEREAMDGARNDGLSPDGFAALVLDCRRAES